MACAVCGAAAPTHWVRLRQNIGLGVARIARRVEGRLCLRCIHETCLRMNTINGLLGWAGVISFFLAPYFAFANWRQLRSARVLGRLSPPLDRARLRREAIRGACLDVAAALRDGRGRAIARRIANRTHSS